VRSVAQVMDSAPRGLELLLVTRDRDLGSDEPYPGLSGRWVPRGEGRVFYLNTRSAIQWFRLLSELRRRQIRILYLNSLWQPSFSLIPVVLCFLRILPVTTVLLAPRGELSPGALALKAAKKRHFLRVWQGVLNRTDLVWHASNEMEANHIRLSQAPDPSIVISSNQVSQLVGVNTTMPERDRPAFVSIGRISRKKNLQIAIEALTFVTGHVAFDIFGPIEDPGYWSECQASIAKLPRHVAVRYCGELVHDQVVQTFGRYNAFVFPTAGENFGHVIAESLAASCPVICSDETPWSPVLESGGGTVVRQLTPDAWGQALAGYAAMSPADVVATREAAVNAFCRWSAAQDRSNILELVLRREAPGQRLPHMR
jgi:glycosyltransferase involved in cell wall biosynthesis